MVDTVIDDAATTDTTTTETVETQAADTQQTAATTQTTTTETSTAAPEPKAAPDDWAALRAKLSGTDEKILKHLSRYGTLDEFVKGAIATKEKLSKSRSDAKPGADATPEELAAYREANGIPESFDKYEVNLPNGIVVGEADKPFMDSFLKAAHEENLTPAQVNKLAATQLELREAEVQRRTELDMQSKAEAEKALTGPDGWGSEAKMNINMIQSLLDTAPAGVKETIANARAADGTPLANHVPTLKFLASLARTVNPHATVVPGSGSNSDQVLDSEIARLDKMMRTDSKEYYKGKTSDGKTTNEARYRELLEVKLARGKKG